MSDSKASLLSPEKRSLLRSLGLLFGRITAGGFMALNHGWGKFSAFSTLSTKFADPLGVGTTTSLALAVFAELFCAVLLVLGLGTRVCAFFLAFTMFVAGIVVHWADPLKKKEMALLYMGFYLVFLFAGPGKFSLDAVLFPRLEGED